MPALVWAKVTAGPSISGPSTAWLIRLVTSHMQPLEPVILREEGLRVLPWWTAA